MTDPDGYILGSVARNVCRADTWDPLDPKVRSDVIDVAAVVVTWADAPSGNTKINATTAITAPIFVNL